ncbi:MAG: alcohol dehydrogenase catalytic domain-containing protein [Acidobacteria bacterium]|nr:alcohol dehydrogenase catalytic domain-containing protein [Acidobacteriota bacterium]
MRAMVLRAAGDLAAADVETPAPGPDEVLVRVRYSAICGTDLKIFTGAIPVGYPLIMGHEMSGEIADGHGGDSLKRGDRVVVDPVLYCGDCVNCRAGQTNLCPNGALVGRDANGGFADYVVVPRTHVFRIPEAIEYRVAPAIQVLTTCVHAQRRADIFPGQSVVVLGLGVTGQLHAQLARARGAYPVIGVSRSAWKRTLAEDLGADMTMPAGDAAVRRVREATGGRGPDVVIETTGVVRSIADAMAVARLGGTMLLFGITTVSDGALPFYQLYFKELNVVNARAAKSEDFPDSIDLVARGVVKLLPLVTQVMPLSELAPAIDMLRTDVDGRMKIILEHL